MKQISFFLGIILLLSFNTYSQEYNGIWQGLITYQSTDYTKSHLIYLDLKIQQDEIEGFVRIEMAENDYYAYKKVYGHIKDGVLKFRDTRILKSKNKFRQNWCLNHYVIHYDESSAYLKGTYDSDECKHDYGSIILYRSKEKVISKSDSALYSKTWRKKFLSDLKRNKPAPEIMDKQMKNFIFEPVNFDHDSSIVKTEFHPYLKELADIVMSHSDLRIKIIGHTDAVGTNEYNIGLSKRRAESIKTFLIKQGLKGDRIEIEYKGETQPIGTNNTDEGKQQNRRVDVIFI